MQPLLLVAVSVCGPAHAAAGVPCQDACATVRLGPGGAALILADGAGSAQHAAAGARAAVRGAGAALRAAAGTGGMTGPEAGAGTAADASAAEGSGGRPAQGGGGRRVAAAVTERPAPQVVGVAGGVARGGVREAGAEPGGAGAIAPAPSMAPTMAPADLARVACGAARAAVAKRAAALGVGMRELACTLLVAVWQCGQVGVAHVGDGAALGWGDERWVVLSEPAETEYVNETRFLTDGDWPRQLRVGAGGTQGFPGAIPRLDGVLCFTDGCQRAALRRDPTDGTLVPFAGFLDPLARFAARSGRGTGARQALAALLTSPKLAACSEDDKTLALIWRGADGGG